MTVAALAAAIRRGELSPREAVQDALERIERDDPAYNAFITVRGDEALAEADALGPPGGPLHGVPVGVKDVIDVAGTPHDGRVEGARGQRGDRRRGRRGAAAARPARSSSGSSTRTSSPGAPRRRARRSGPARNPWDTGADLRRLERGQRRRRRGGLVARRARHRHGRVRADPRRALRRHRDPAEHGPRPEPGRDPRLVDVRHGRPARAHGRGLRAAPRRDRRAEPGDASTTRVRRAVPRGSGVASRGCGSASSPTCRGRAARPAVGARSRRRSPSSGGSAPGRAGRRAVPAARRGRRSSSSCSPRRPRRTSPGCARGSPTTAPTCARACSPACSCPRPPRSPASGPGARSRDEARPLFERFDLLAAPEMPIVAPRIGEDPVEVGGQELPYRLALIPFNSPWSCLGLPTASVPCGLRRRPAGRARADRPAPRRGDGAPRGARLPAGDRLARARRAAAVQLDGAARRRRIHHAALRRKGVTRCPC